MTGKIAAVTGAAGGIGSGIVRALVEVGATVALIDRDAAACMQLRDEILAAGGRAIAVGCDLSLPAEISAAAARVEEELGPADILVNNAGLLQAGGIDELSLDAWHATLAVNLTGYFLCAQAFGRQMLARGIGSLIHIASIAASSPQAASGAYSVSKAGIQMLSQQLATEWGPRGIRSNVVSPGLILTPMSKPFYDTLGVHEARRALVPARRIGEPADVANAVVFLASDRAGYISGVEITVDGGFTRTIMNVIPRPGFAPREF